MSALKSMAAMRTVLTILVLDSWFAGNSWAIRHPPPPPSLADVDEIEMDLPPPPLSVSVAMSVLVSKRFG